MKNGNIHLKMGGVNYPDLLIEIPKPPAELYARGEIDSWKKPCVAIVGTRKATSYGLKVARDLARDLAGLNITIVSGLALGIDTEAHKGAIEAGGKTIAVLGSGINQVYPAVNRSLAERIVESGGALISELPPEHPPEKWTFPQRNRIIAGLSQMTLVIEAPEKSGALITAYLALEYNRDVGAVPGEITSINSSGTNNLIRLGASLIRSSEDILNVLGINQGTIMLDNLDKIEKVILQCLAKPQMADEILKATGAPLEVMNQKLSMLELNGIIKNEGGRWHKT